MELPSESRVNIGESHVKGGRLSDLGKTFNTKKNSSLYVFLSQGERSLSKRPGRRSRRRRLVLVQYRMQIQSKLIERKVFSYSYHRGGRTWLQGGEEGSGGADWCLCNYMYNKFKVITLKMKENILSFLSNGGRTWPHER